MFQSGRSCSNRVHRKVWTLLQISSPKTVFFPDFSFCRNLRVLQNFHYVLNVRIKKCSHVFANTRKNYVFWCGQKTTSVTLSSLMFYPPITGHLFQ